MPVCAGRWLTLVVFLSVSVAWSTCRADEPSALKSLKALGAKERQDLQREGQPIVQLALKGPQITDEAMDSVVELPQLETLSINSASISGAGLKKLAALTKLTSLSLYGCSITADDLAELSTLTALETLDIRNTQVFALGQATPIRLPAVKRLRISVPLNMSNNKMLDLSRLAELDTLVELTIVATASPFPFTTDFTPARRLKNLTILRLDYFSEKALIGLGQLTSLREIGLAGPGWVLAKSGHVLTDRVFSELKSLTDLHTLDLTGREISTAGYEALGTLSQLRHLNLKGTNISDAELKHLQGLKTLVSLDLNGTNVTDKGVSDLRQSLPSTNVVFRAGKESQESITAKKELGKFRAMFTSAIRADTMQQSVNGVILRRTSIQDDDLKYLQAFTQMASVDLSDTAITDRGVEILVTLKQLRTLKINRTKITDHGIQQLSQLTELRTLELGGLPITDAGLDKLRTLKKLQELTIDGSGVSSDSINQLKAALPKLQLTN